MAFWYCSGDITNTSSKYYAVAKWAATTAYTLGQIVRQNATPTVGSERCFRCTTAGTSLSSEPTWVLTKGSTTTESGGPVWTEVTGNSTYGWSAPHCRLETAMSWAAAGDTVYLDSAHSQTASATATNLAGSGTAANPVKVLSVNSSTAPPTALLAGASVANTENLAGCIDIYGFTYFNGVTFNTSGGGTSSVLYISYAGSSSNLIFEGCIFQLKNSATPCMYLGAPSTQSSDITFINTTTVANGACACAIQFAGGTFTWRDTVSALGTTYNTTEVIALNLNSRGVINLQGLGLGENVSELIYLGSVTSPSSVLINVSDCELGAIAITGGTPTSRYGTINLTRSDTGSLNYRSEKYMFEGSVVTDAANYNNAGASDGTTAYSLKMVTTTYSSFKFPLYSQDIMIWNDVVGVSKTVSLEIASSATLTADQIWLEVEGLTNASYPISATQSSAAATLASLQGTAGSAVPTSSATWTDPGISTPVLQTLSVTFTPQMKGPMKARVCLAKPSATVWIDPKLAVV
jgi:hypothetical protein